MTTQLQTTIPALVAWDGFVPEPIEHADDVWLTAEQIGIALEYEDPGNSIRRLYNRHRDLLDPYTGQVKLTSPGGQQLTRIFNEEGVILLCLKANKPKAIAFQRWAAAELKARRRARVTELGSRNAWLEDRVTYLTQKLIELHERHEKRVGKKDKRVTLADARAILDMHKKGFQQGEIAGLTGWSRGMVWLIIEKRHPICAEIEKEHPELAVWLNPDPRRLDMGRRTDRKIAATDPLAGHD